MIDGRSQVPPDVSAILARAFRPERSGEWMENGSNHELLENPAMARHSLSILANLPELGPCLREWISRSPKLTQKAN